MVIINTSATDVSIHAVSPELGVHFSRILPPQAGGPASCASAMSPNARQRIAVPKRAATTDTSLWRAYVPDSMVSLLLVRDVGEGLHSRFVGLSSPNAEGSLVRRNKDLTVADRSCRVRREPLPPAAPSSRLNGWVYALAETSLMTSRPFPNA